MKLTTQNGIKASLIRASSREPKNHHPNPYFRIKRKNTIPTVPFQAALNQHRRINLCTAQNFAAAQAPHRAPYVVPVSVSAFGANLRRSYAHVISRAHQAIGCVGFCWRPPLRNPPMDPEIVDSLMPPSAAPSSSNLTPASHDFEVSKSVLQ